MTLIKSHMVFKSTMKTQGSNDLAKLVIPTLKVTAASTITMRDEVTYKLISSSKLLLGATSKILGRDLSIEADKMETEQGSIIDLNYQGENVGAGELQNRYLLRMHNF